jgi:hypothetical protein
MMGGAAIALAIRTAPTTSSPGIWSAIRGGDFLDLCFSGSWCSSLTLYLRSYHAYDEVSCLCGGPVVGCVVVLGFVFTASFWWRWIWFWWRRIWLW